MEQVGSVRHVEMLYRSNLLAVVGGGPNARYADNTGSICLVILLLCFQVFLVRARGAFLVLFVSWSVVLITKSADTPTLGHMISIVFACWLTYFVSVADSVC